jgi:hypothetical protein
MGDRLQRPVDAAELTAVLEQRASDPYRSVSFRSQVRGLLLDKVLLKELADALTILFQHMDEWDWPRAGVPAQARMTPNKWRLFLNDALPNACFLELLAGRWQEIFRILFKGQQQARLRYLRRLQAGNDEETAGEDVGVPVNLTTGLDLLGEMDVLGETTPADRNPPGPLTLQEQMRRWVEYSSVDHRSIFMQRAREREQLRKLGEQAGYGEGNALSGLERALMFINAEVQLARAAFPDRPFYVLKVDLKEFYPSLAHDLLFSILQRYGLSAAQVDFFRKFLRLPLAYKGQIAQAQRGVPLGPHLSDVLGELVLGLLEQYVQREARVQIVRMVDDICVLTPSAEEAAKAWEALQQFCAACGLTLNLEKCGAVCIGGERPAGLPAAQPGWLLLSLDNQGWWDVNEAALDAYLEQARQQVTQAPSFIARVQAYNALIKYLVIAMGLRIPLGEHHRQSIRRVMQRLHHAFLGEGQGMVETLRQIIRERFLGKESLTAVPEAWLYWPITAGGAGLTQAPLLAAAYGQDFSQGWKPVVPEERTHTWQHESLEWRSFYAMFFNEVEPQAPTPNQVMETLVQDFIRRGATLSVGAQKGLSPYWRWILYIYGPQILEHLGTFRFLITELVPLQLVGSRKVRDVLAGGDNGADDDIPF